MLPGLGDHVIYTVSAADAAAIARQRIVTRARGNAVAPIAAYAAIVVATFGQTANLQVMLDGQDHFWVCSVAEGDGPGTWRWPPRV